MQDRGPEGFWLSQHLMLVNADGRCTGDQEAEVIVVETPARVLGRVAPFYPDTERLENGAVSSFNFSSQCHPSLMCSD